MDPERSAKDLAADLGLGSDGAMKSDVSAIKTRIVSGQALILALICLMTASIGIAFGLVVCCRLTLTFSIEASCAYPRFC